MYTVQMVLRTHYSLKVASLKTLQLWELCTEHRFQGWGGDKDPPIASVQIPGRSVVMSSHGPPPLFQREYTHKKKQE